MNRQKKRGQTVQIIVGVAVVGFAILGGWLIGKGSRSTANSQAASSVQASQTSTTSTSSVTTSEEPIQTSTTQQEEPVVTEPAQSVGMQTQQLLAGDFSAVVGTWANGYGQTLTFTEAGLADEGTQLQELVASEVGSVRGYLVLGATGGGTIEFLPAGVLLPDYSYDRDGVVTVATDSSNSQVDRIWVGQDLTTISDPASYYYLVNP